MTHIETLVFRAVGDTFTLAGIIYDRLTKTVPTKTIVDEALGGLVEQNLITMSPASYHEQQRAGTAWIEYRNKKWTGAQRRTNDRNYTKTPTPTPVGATA